MKIRRIVTGHGGDGEAVVTDDDMVEPVTLELLPGFGTFELWSTDDVPVISEGAGQPGIPSYFPDLGGSVFRVVTFPPDGGGLPAGVDFGAALEEASTKVPALVAHLEPDNPGMHTTDTLDYGIVIDGELDLELDDGRTVHVTPGCCIVQRGTRHAWRNRSDRPATVAFVLVGARRS